MDTIKKLVQMEHLVDTAGIVQPPSSRLRFGELAVSLGYVKVTDVQAALAVQRLERESGKTPRLVGEILVDMGRLSRLQVSKVLDALVKSAHRRRTRPTVGGQRFRWSSDLVGPLVA